MKKQRLALKVALVLLAACQPLPGGGVCVQAYLTGHDEARNQIRLCEHQISIEEEYEPPDTVEPGVLIPKSPVIRNDSITPCQVRVRVAFSSAKAQALCEELVVNPHWNPSGDGLYDYDLPVPPGGSTEPVFSYVQIRSDLTQEEIDEACPFEIYVYAEALAWGQQAGEG